MLVGHCIQSNPGMHRHSRVQDTQETALMWAAQEGHLETVQLLLDNGAKTAIKDAMGHTALDMARRNDHSHIVDILMEEDRRLKASSCCMADSIKLLASHEHM